MESINHLFCQCPFVTNLWTGFDGQNRSSLVDFVERLLHSNDIPKILGLPARLSAIWSACNDALWNNRFWTAKHLVESSRERVNLNPELHMI